MNTAGLTERQAQALRFIADRIAGGVSPSLTEIGAHLGIAYRSGVHRLLVGLRERGRIDWHDHKQRSIRLMPDAGYVLPAAVQLALEQYCAARGERAAGVVGDAVALHLDLMDGADPSEAFEVLA